MTIESGPSSSAEMQPEQRVGVAMREARELSGISLRQLARHLGYHSHTTLSSYERGAVMPTDEAVRGYEQVLGLQPGTLSGVLETARTERHGDAWAKRRVHLPVEFAGRPTGPPDSAPSTNHVHWSRRRWPVIGTGVLVASLIAFVSVDLLIGHHHKPAPTAASRVAGVRDGADPSVTGCATGAITADAVNFYDPPEHLAGIFQLRSSARCGTSWGRFVPTPALAIEPKITLEIDVYRPADAQAAKFRVTYDGLIAYGNMLLSRYQCVYAQLTLFREGRASAPPVQTACLKAPS